MRRSALPLLLLALVATFTAGCDDTPTEPDRVLPFSGTITRAQLNTPKVHPFALSATSNARIRLDDAKLRLADGTSTPASIIIGLGRPATDGTCTLSSSVVYVVGDVSSHGLRAGSYCLGVTSGTTIPETPEGTVVTYAISIEVTE